MVFTLENIVLNKTYSINGVYSGDALSASAANETTIRLLNKITQKTNDYSTASDFSDFDIAGDTPSDVNDAVQKINDIVNFPKAGGTAQTPLLLDLYPGAKMAYSFQKIRNDYAGACCRVYKTVLGTPFATDINFGTTYVSTSAILNFAADADGGDVYLTKLYDQSTSGIDAEQTTAGKMHKVVSAGSLILDNGKLAFSYPGVGTGIRLTAPSVTLHSNVMIFSTLNVTQRNSIICRHGTGIGNSMTFGISSQAQNITRAGSDTLTAPVGWANGSQKVVSFTYDQTDRIKIYDGTNAAQSGTAGGSVQSNKTTTANFSIGGNDSNTGTIYFIGNIQELIIYNNMPTTTRLDIVNNRKAFYNIP